MVSAVLVPPAAEEQLRERAEELADDVERELLPRDDAPVDGVGEQREMRVARRQAFFDAVRMAVRSLAGSSAWRSHDLATELMLLVEELRDAIASNPDAVDSEWREREVLQRMLVVLRTMVRQLVHDAIDRPEQAAGFVATALADVEIDAVADLLGVSPRTVTNYRAGQVGQVRKNPNRLTLIGQLVYELRGAMTPRGVLLWFATPAPALGGRTPRELLDEDPVVNRPALMALARGGRSQLDRGGALYGGVEPAA